MKYIFGDEIIASIKERGTDVSIFEGGETEDDPIILRCNDQTGTYEAADMIHIYIENWASVNNFKIAQFDENRLMHPDAFGRIYDNVFYNFYKDENDTYGIDGVLFVFDVTEPHSKVDPYDLSYLEKMDVDGQYDKKSNAEDKQPYFKDRTLFITAICLSIVSSFYLWNFGMDNALYSIPSVIVLWFTYIAILFIVPNWLSAVIVCITGIYIFFG